MPQAQDFRFNPVTKDLIDAPDGSFVQTDRADTAVMLQLDSHFGEWWGDPDAGSRLHDLRAFQTDPGPGLLDEATRALDVLVEAGRISDVEVTIDAVLPGRVDLSTRFRDASTGQLVETLVTPGG
jgi:phage gp46-like protein